jgi:hypothetical protein
MQLTQLGWITFDEAPNINVNPLSNHVISSGSVNALAMKDPRSLNVSRNRVYKMLVEARYKKGSYEEVSTRRNFCRYHREKGHVII